MFDLIYGWNRFLIKEMERFDHCIAIGVTSCRQIPECIVNELYNTSYENARKRFV